MVVETLARRAELRRLSALEARDGLVAWFVHRAEPQARKGMQYTSPGASRDEVAHVLHLRARAFFERLASSWEDPTWADLRRVKARMQSWLLPRRSIADELFRETELWDFLLVGGPGPRSAARY